MVPKDLMALPSWLYAVIDTSRRSQHSNRLSFWFGIHGCPQL